MTTLKSNNVSTMAITTGTAGALPRTATVTGKATINGVGNYAFVITAVDTKDPNSDGTDRYGQRVTDATGAVVTGSSFATSAVAAPGEVFVGKS